jgi:hypothetical protein
MTDFIVIDILKLVGYSTDTDLIIKYYNNMGIPIPSDKKANPFMTDSSVYDYVVAIWAMSACMNVSKIWVNPKNGFIIAYQDTNGYHFSEHFSEHLLEINVSEVSESYIIERQSNERQSNELSLDMILDKINTSGIESLSLIEKKFLEKI